METENVSLGYHHCISRYLSELLLWRLDLINRRFQG